jgi:O-antigen ligase
MIWRRAFEKWLFLFAALAVAATALAYPMRLSASPGPDLFGAVQRFFYGMGDPRLGGWGVFFETHLRAPLQFGYNPLVLKETLGALAVVLMALGYVPWKLVHCPRRKERTGLHAPLLIFLCLAGMSLLWTSAVHATMLTIEALFPAAVFLLMVSDIDWGPAARRKFLAVIAGAGAVLCVAGFCQTFPPLARFYYLFFHEFTDPRNTLGSWIGHNTELSSYVLSSFLAGLALILTTKSKIGRIALGAFLILSAYIIVAGQSRIIWPLAPLLCGALALASSKQARRHIRLWHVLAAATVVILLCIPLAPQLRQRIQHYRPESIKKETRLRILFASGSLVAERPWIGHGLGSFMKVYPKAQADFFRHHPDTFLSETDRRTEHAHNEYLQLLIELGAAGLALFLLGITIYLVIGFKGWRRCADARDRTVSFAFFLIALQHMANAAVNFPGHVASSAYLALLCLGVWVSLDRETENRRLNRKRVLPSNFILRTGILIACLLPLAVAPILAARIANEAVVDTHNQFGQGALENFGTASKLSAEDQQKILQVASYFYDKAQKMDRLNWLPLFGKARVALLDGRSAAQAAANLGKTPGMEKQAAAAVRHADAQLGECVRLLTESFEEYASHQSYYVAAQAFIEREKLFPGPQYAEEIQRYLEQTVEYCGVFYPGLKDLAEFYVSTGGSPDSIAGLHVKMRKDEPDRYREDYVKPAERHLILGEFDEGARSLGFVCHALPDSSLLRASMIIALAESGDIAGARRELTRMEKDLGPVEDYWRGVVRTLIAEGEIDRALKLALFQCAESDPPDPWFATYATGLLIHAGRPDEAALLWAKATASMSPNEESARLGARAWLLYEALGAADLALADIYAQDFYLIGVSLYIKAKIEFDRGQYAAAARDAEMAIQREFNGRPARDLLKQAREKLGEAPAQEEPASAP